MLRKYLLTGVTDSINSDINGLDNGAFISAVKDVFSFNATSFGKSFTASGSTFYILMIAIVCIVAMTIAYNRTYKRK